jgi:hypothetical protein
MSGSPQEFARKNATVKAHMNREDLPHVLLSTTNLGSWTMALQSDMRMPGVHGATLLISRYLTEPCAPDQLFNVRP